LDTKILRLLIVDASPDDTELTLAALQAGGFLLKSHCVQDLKGLQAAIAQGGWDAVIAERKLAHSSATAVLDTLRRANLEIPLLILTRAVPDEEIAVLMRAGARDVVLKNQISRLLPALERELAVAAERAQFRAGQEALKEMQEKHRAVVERGREAVCYVHDGMHIDANKAYLDMFGYASLAELEGVPVMNLIDKSDQARFKQHIRKSADVPEEFAAVRKNGERFYIETAVSRVTINGEACTQLLVTDISQLKAVEAKLQYLSEHDPLTGLYNRNHFLESLTRAVEQAKRDGTAHGIVYIGLRQAMRTLEHAAVDRFLLAVGRELREIFGSEDRVARYGDHEFAALTQEAQRKQLREIAARVEQALAAGPLSDSGLPGNVGYRVSFASITAQTESVQKALAALYPAREPAAAARAGSPPAPVAEAPAVPASSAEPTPVWPETSSPAHGSPQPPIAAPDWAAPAAARSADSEWRRRIGAAIRREAFRLIYQPIVNLHGDAAEYFEVLVRMVDDGGGLIPAALFIPPAEDSGQALAIDHWVIKQSIRTLAELRHQGRKVTFFINLSARALRDPMLALAAQQALRETRIKSKYVIFEIDEAAFLAHAEAAAAFTSAAKKIGCSLCIDNFGRALDAAPRLRDVPVEYLKLDGALLQNITSDAVTQAPLKAVVDVAKAMKKKTIAKSVESVEALSALWEFGVDYVQGRYFQEADAELNYEFHNEATLSSENSPHWTVASPRKSR